jgi:hypothetical protein
MFLIYLAAFILLGSVIASAFDLVLTSYQAFRAHRAHRANIDLKGMVDGSIDFLEDRYRQLTADREAALTQ